MADLKITDLNNYTTPLDADVLPIVDVANLITKKIPISAIFPASADDNAITRFDGTTGKLLQNSVLKISDLSANQIVVTPPSVAGVGTTISLLGGTSTGDIGGSIAINGGDGGGTGGGGNVVITGGGVTGSGAKGKIFLFEPGLSFAGILDLSLIAASNKTFSFPNFSGAIALQTGATNFATDAGSTDDYVITLSPVPVLTTGMIVVLKANTANTGASTLNVNGTGAVAIVKAVSTALSNNDILANMFCLCVYNGSVWVLMNPRAL